MVFHRKPMVFFKYISLSVEMSMDWFVGENLQENPPYLVGKSRWFPV